MKAFTKILAVAFAAAGVITVAGCSGGTPNAKVATNANWNVRTSASVENNFTDRWLNYKEVATYSIKLTDGVNSTYSVKYGDCSLQTEFYMEQFDWSKVTGLPEGYGADKGVELVYVYKTVSEMTGEYVHTKTGDTKKFTDKVDSTCYYRLAGNNLQPVYSYQAIKDVAPNTLNATSIENACIEIDDVYETFYNYDCTKATLARKNNITNKEEVKQISVNDKEGHSVFDNSQLWSAVRAFTLSGGARYAFNVVVPQNGGLQSCYATCTAPVMLNKEKEDQLQIINALKDCSEKHSDYIFFEDNAGEGEDARNFRFNAVSLGINANSPMTGAANTFWYSTVENSDINYSKCVLLRMSNPLSFGLGTLNYTLKSLELKEI